MATEVILTAEGLQKLKDELDERETTVRAEISERIKVARDFGDISENSEYDDAKNEQALNETRISEINRILSNARIAESPRHSGRVSIGSKITLLMPNGKKRVLQVVGSTEADPVNGRISNESAVGAAVLGRKKGETVVTHGPTGKTIEIKVLEIANN